MKTTIYQLINCIFCTLIFFPLFSQTILYEENCGTPTAVTLIQQHTGWQNQEVIYSSDGTCDLRLTNVSAGYPEASGGANVLLNNNIKWFSISRINTSGRDSVTLHLGIRKGNIAENGSNFSAEYSTDSVEWIRLPILNFPTGYGTTGWYRVHFPGLPSTENLHLKFRNLANGDFRLDDFSITAHSAQLTPSLLVLSPRDGGNYESNISLDLTVNHFEFGHNGYLRIAISSETYDTTFQIYSQDELTELEATPLYLGPGDFQLEASLLDTNGLPLSPEVSVNTSFTIVLPTVVTPDISPTGGIYSGMQHISINCSTEGATIYYSIDGSTPDNESLMYTAPIAIDHSCTLKAIAQKQGMISSDIATAEFIIQEYDSVIILPFDIRDNSENAKEDITRMSGFYAENIGSSYSDGSAKFEQGKAGSAILYAILDSAPDTLWFDLRGRNGGSAPQGYEGITFEILESQDNENWQPLVSLSENEISNSQYVSFTVPLSQETRYIKWFLAEATKGNTQLNNIKISKYEQTIIDTTIIDTTIIDTTYVLNYNDICINIYPIPTEQYLTVDAGNIIMNDIQVVNMSGDILRTYPINSTYFRFQVSALPSGIYLIRIKTDKGLIVKKFIKK